MTIESEMLGILMKYGIRHLSAFLEEDEIKVRIYGNSSFDQREYYQKNKEKIRKYQSDYYLRTRGKKVKQVVVTTNNYIPTPEDLANAMAHLYSKDGMTLRVEDLRDTAMQVMQFFGFEREVVGNHLEPDEISLMYQLEDIGLVTTRIEEHNLLDGKPWRVNYFILNSKKVKEFSSRNVGENQDEVSQVYENLPEEAWAR